MKHLIDRHEKLVDKVRRMRGYQKEYFKYRTRQDLELSKRFEREVDQILREEVSIKESKQKEIF